MKQSASKAVKCWKRSLQTSPCFFLQGGQNFKTLLCNAPSRCPALECRVFIQIWGGGEWQGGFSEHYDAIRCLRFTSLAQVEMMSYDRRDVPMLIGFLVLLDLLLLFYWVLKECAMKCPLLVCLFACLSSPFLLFVLWAPKKVPLESGSLCDKCQPINSLPYGLLVIRGPSICGVQKEKQLQTFSINK